MMGWSLAIITAICSGGCIRRIELARRQVHPLRLARAIRQFAHQTSANHEAVGESSRVDNLRFLVTPSPGH